MPTTQIILSFFGLVLVGVVMSCLSFVKRRRAIEENVKNRLRVNIASEKDAIVPASGIPMNTWRGFKKFRVFKKRVETTINVKEQELSDICSFYMEPLETPKPLPTFQPGQHLSFELDTDRGRIVRFYSLSDSPSPDHYRVSIKRALAPRGAPAGTPNGQGSNHFHDTVLQDGIIKVAKPNGDFYLDKDEDKESPVVLLAGGIGITPMVSISKTLAQQNSNREVLFFLGIRNAKELALIEDLSELADHFESWHLYVCMSNPDGDLHDLAKKDRVTFLTGLTSEGQLQVDLEGEGIRVSVDVLKNIIGEVEGHDFYLCGPPPMMKSLVDGLYFWGVPRNQVHWEGFGPCAVIWPGDVINSLLRPCVITFIDTNSGDKKIYLDWKPASGSVLNLADKNTDAVPKLKRQCGQGVCGECKITFKGKVTYDKEPDFGPLKANECLACCCKPEGDISIYIQ